MRHDRQTMKIPDDLQDVLNQIDAADRAADVLVEGLSDAQFHWQPNEGRSWSVQPESSKPRADVLAHYHDAHRLVRELISDCADLDVNRAAFKNLFFSLIKVRVGTALRLIAAHDRRHLWQAEQVKKAPDFPRA